MSYFPLMVESDFSSTFRFFIEDELLSYRRESLLLLVLPILLLSLSLLMERGGRVEVTLSSSMVENIFSSTLLFFL